MVGTSTTRRSDLSTDRNSATVEMTCTLKVRLEAVDGIIGEASRFDVGYIFLHGGADAGAALQKIAHEALRFAARYSQHVVQYQHLAAAPPAGAYADGGNRERARQIA